MRIGSGVVNREAAHRIAIRTINNVSEIVIRVAEETDNVSAVPSGSSTSLLGLPVSFFLDVIYCFNLTIFYEGKNDI
jgi:hypothetical protein